MDALERIAPKRLAEDWDNPGLLVGAPDQDVRRILVCLDVSDSVVEYAIRSGADMIVAIAGEILRMPGLPKKPQAEHIDIVDGNIEGLS
jgi:putative NIF3 family GTP cyclohydrolase 1 type 2